MSEELTSVVEEPTEPETAEIEEEEKEEEKEYSGRKIMCYISKRMVPIEDTVEVEYSLGKSYRVLPQYIKEA